MPNGWGKPWEYEWQWPWQQPARAPEKTPTGGLTEWYRGLKERGEEELAWLLPQLSRKEYEEGLEIYLVRMVEAGSFSEDYADELEVWAKQRIAAEGVHEGLPFYTNVSQRHITPQWWQEQYRQWQVPKLAEQAWRGQRLAEIATRQREATADLIPREGGGWLKPIEERYKTEFYEPTGGPYHPDLIKTFNLARELGVDTSSFEKARTQPWPNRPEDLELENELRMRIAKQVWEPQRRRELLGFRQEQAGIAKQFPEQWRAIQQKVPYPTQWTGAGPGLQWAGIVEKSPEYERLKAKAHLQSLWGQTTLIAHKAEQERAKRTRQTEMWHRPGRWAVPGR